MLQVAAAHGGGGRLPRGARAARPVGAGGSMAGAISVNNLATAIEDLGDLAAPRAAYTALARAAAGSAAAVDLGAVRARHNPRFLLRSGRTAAARPMLAEAEVVRSGRLPASHPEVLDSRWRWPSSRSPRAGWRPAAAAIDAVRAQEAGADPMRRAACTGCGVCWHWPRATRQRRGRAHRGLVRRRPPHCRRPSGLLRHTVDLAQAAWLPATAAVARALVQTLQGGAGAARPGSPLRRRAEAIAAGARRRPDRPPMSMVRAKLRQQRRARRFPRSRCPLPPIWGCRLGPGTACLPEWRPSCKRPALRRRYL